MEIGLSPTIAPLLLRNLLASIFIYAHKSLIFISEKNEFLQLVRCFLTTAFLFFLRLLPSFFPSLNPSPLKSKKNVDEAYPAASTVRGIGDSGVARALSQLLLIMNDIPVSSRKYEVVRSLVDKLIDENLLEGDEALRDVNCAVLSVAFARSLSQLEAAIVDHAGARNGDDSYVYGGDSSSSSRVRRLVKQYGWAMWRYYAKVSRMEEGWAEKLAAEVLWVAQKMAACGCVDEAVCKWADASNLAWLALSAEPRLQGSLVKVSAYLIKQAKEMGKGDARVEEADQQQQHTRQIKMKMLMSWLPLLCRASNGTDAPILSLSERAELEKIVEDIIWTLDEEEEQERVLSLWLHHFTYCPTADWPNLRTCYTQWYGASRQRLVLPDAVTAASVK